MPVVIFTLPEGMADADGCRQLTQLACEAFARVMDAPSERIRAYVTQTGPHAAWTGGGLNNAAFYQFSVLNDRSSEIVAELHKTFCALLEDVIQADKSQIRGVCQRVHPDDWGIAGLAASSVRKAELSSRNCR